MSIDSIAVIMTKQIRIGDRITSMSEPKIRQPDPVFEQTKTEPTKTDNWILDVLNPLSPLSPLSPFNINNWE